MILKVRALFSDCILLSRSRCSRQIHRMQRWTVHLEGGPRRVNHAAVSIGDYIFSFGGYCTGENFEVVRPIDVHVLNTSMLDLVLISVLSCITYP